MSRVRRVEDRRALERSIDEFITRGYRLMSEGETSARLKEKDWGDGITHAILVVLTGWWTFGLANALYAIYSYVTADEIVIKLEDAETDESSSLTHDSEKDREPAADGSESELAGGETRDRFVADDRGDETAVEDLDRESTDDE